MGERAGAVSRASAWRRAGLPVRRGRSSFYRRHAASRKWTRAAAQALEIVALLETRTSRADLKLQAKRIDISQADEIRMTKTWLADRGVPEPGNRGQEVLAT